MHGAAKHNAHIVLSVWCIVVVNPVFARPSGQQPLKCISHPLLHHDDNEHEYMIYDDNMNDINHDDDSVQDRFCAPKFG